MRNLILIGSLIGLVTGCNNNGVKAGGVDMAMAPIVDMAVGPDIAAPNYEGIPCGTATCKTGGACCVDPSSTPPKAACVDTPASCTTGASLTCDGPEDCNAGGYCCGTISFSLGDPDAGTGGGLSGANATCTGTCAASFDQQTNSGTSRLCHVAADCKGLSINFMGFPAPLSECCSITGVPVQFCFTSLASQFGIQGLTCN